MLLCASLKALNFRCMYLTDHYIQSFSILAGFAACTKKNHVKTKGL